MSAWQGALAKCYSACGWEGVSELKEHRNQETVTLHCRWALSRPWESSWNNMPNNESCSPPGWLQSGMLILSWFWTWLWPQTRLFATNYTNSQTRSISQVLLGFQLVDGQWWDFSASIIMRTNSLQRVCLCVCVCARVCTCTCVCVSLIGSVSLDKLSDNLVIAPY